MDVRGASQERDGSWAFRDVVPPAVVAAYEAEGWWGTATLSDSVARWAAEAAHDAAFVVGDSVLTWSEYDRESTRLAQAFVAAGLQPGDRVAVWLPDGAEVHIAFMAAERAALTVVGVGARAGDLELEHILRRTAARAIVTLDRLGGAPVAPRIERVRAAGLSLRHFVVSSRAGDRPLTTVVDGAAIEAADDSLPTPIGPNDLFMINSTSGTTGLPKCVMHTQNRWMYFHQKAAEFGGLRGDDRFLSLIPAPFGFGLWTAHFTPTLLGAQTAVMERFDAEQALSLIERHRITVVCCVSTQFILMLRSEAFGSTDLSSLRVMFTGGEAVPIDQARRWEQSSGSKVLQFFGSNETGLLSGTKLSDTDAVRLGTCGRIVDEMNVRLFDEGADVTASGRGQPGCRGPATCVGYLDDPEANRALFTSDGWMLMADECEIDLDGHLRVVGRKSDIIIRGGKNISAAEVERHALTHPGIALAAAMAMPDPVFGERVCLYAQPADGRDAPSLAELCAHMASRGVSKELLPERLVVLQELSRSSGGKVAKGELREDLERRLASEAGGAIRT